MNLLAEMQYEPALDKTGEILKSDFQEYYWKSIFIFGKMGDISVPFLLKRINDGDKNVRAHAINALGQWLIEPAAAAPLQEHYWAEKDMQIRGMILSSIERITPDLDELKKFFSEVVAKEKDKDLLTFAQETLNNLGQMSQAIKTFHDKKRVSAPEFQAEYQKLYDSAGKKGNTNILSQTSTPGDEPKLKLLRQRILQRNSDECFEDYQKINEIIMFNRFLSKAAK
ncbi:MAG: HEAT repeat domain-containing protein [Planctomycetaceae bacterium]|nr:HEAT repeat domain-containing protein [Planctomycetaceae bacterium]